MRLIHRSFAVARRFALAAAWLIMAAPAVQAQGNVTPPNGTHSQEVIDLSVQTIAGEVVWKRVFNGTGWRFNRGWDGISASFKPMLTQNTGGGSPVSATSTGEPEVCWIWVDEDWEPSDGVAGLPGTGTSTDPVRVSPQSYLPGNKSHSQTGQPLSASIGTSFASACGGIGGNITGGTSGMTEEFEGYRKGSALYVGSGGTYIFKNRYLLKKQAVQRLPVLAGEPAGGNVSLANLDSVAQGWRWADRAGDWAEYDDSGRISRYGDKNNNTVWIQRNASGQIARIAAAANGASSAEVAITLHYNTGGFLAQAKDYPQVGNALDLPQRVVNYGYDAYGRMTGVTDVRGKTAQYTYDPKARLTQSTDPLGRATKLVYDTDGTTVKQMIAADGGVSDFVFSYDDTKKLFYSKSQGPVTPAGRRIEDYTHDRAGDLVRYEVNGRTEVEVKRDPVARTETRINARGFATVYTKNEFEQIVQVQNPDGTKQTTQYEARLLNPLEDTDEAGIKTKYEYDTAGNLTKTTKAAGTPDERVTEYEMNASGRVARVVRKGRTEANGTITPDAVWQVSYDAAGQINQTTDPEGHQRAYAYNRLGALAKYTDPRGNSSSYETDAAGNLTKATSALGHVRGYSYDAVGNLITSTNARGKAIQVQYDAMNRRNQITNPVGGQYKLTYNTQSAPISETDEDGRTASAEFDNFLRITRQADALNNVTTYGYQIADGSAAGALGSLTDATDILYPTFRRQVKYDSRERPTSQTLINANAVGTENIVSGQTYDSRGLLNSETDANGKTRLFGYDALGQLVEATDSLGNKTRALYDAASNLIQLTDAKGNATRFTYNKSNRLTSEVQPLGQTTRYVYDPAGNLSERTEARGIKTSYTYDAANRLIQFSQTQLGAAIRTTQLTWDAENNLTAWSDADATRPAGQQTASGTAIYDDAGRKTAETVNYPNPAGAAFSLSYSYQYSAAGLKTQLTWPDGTPIGYSYSAHGELEQVSIPGEGSISINQFKWVAPSKLTLPGGTTQDKTHDGLLNLESLKVKTPGQLTILTLQNSYGKVQELKTSNRADTTNNISSTKNASYQYDDEIRLTQVQTSAGGVFGNDTEAFTLDAVANRITHSKAAGTWSYDANNRLTSRPGQAGAVSYDYDSSGNQTKKTEAGRVTAFGYDSQNRLVEVKDAQNNLISRYGYDLLDRRIWKEQYRDKDGNALAQAKRTYYLFSDEGLIAEATQAIVLNADQSVVASDAPLITAQYGPRPDSEFTTGLMFVKTKSSNGSDTVAYFQRDHLETPVQASDKAGNIVWAASYDAFGRATIITPQATMDKPTISINLRLPGQIEDEETGLNYNGRRYYDSETGRYITQDPIGLEGGVNRYAYVDHDPVSEFDSTGEANSGAVSVIRSPNRFDPPSLPQGLVDFAAGFGDSASLGLTSYIRSQSDIGSVDICSGWYRGGQYAEVGLEIGLTGASLGLRAAAKGISQSAARRGQKIRGSRKDGTEAHHQNPLKQGLFPTAALPQSIRHSSMNMKVMPYAQHLQAHKDLARHEMELLVLVNPATTAARTAKAATQNCDCK